MKVVPASKAKPAAPKQKMTFRNRGIKSKQTDAREKRKKENQ